MRAQRGSQPDDKSQRSVQVRAPTQAQLKSPTWGNEEDDGPMAHPTACKQARGVPAPPRAPSLQSTAHCGADRLNNRALGLDDPQLHPAPRAYPQGRTNARGIASAPAPVTRATARQAGYSPSAHGGTDRLNNRDLRRCSRPTTKHPRSSIDPRGNPAHAPIERGAASAQTIPAAQALGHRTAAVHTRTPPDPSGSDNGRAPAEGHTARATARVIRHSRKPLPPTPQRIKRKGGQRRIVAKATRRTTESNSGTAALPNAPPLPPTASIPGCAAGMPQGSEARPRGERSATAKHLEQGNRRPLRRTQAPSRITNGTGTRRRDYRGPGPRLLDTSHRRHSHSPSGQGVSTPRHATASPVHSDTAHGKAASDAQGPAFLRSTGSQRSSATPNPEHPAKRRRHRPSSKDGDQGNKSSEGHKGKKRKTHLWERNAHVGLGQPRTRHHVQSGRPGHPPTPSLSHKQPPRTGVKKRAHLRQVP
ncbi:hypothetical protein WOLCODRAFT_159515 [Wolfiporia cocos MD-104 SS10]|uniref:Uncharacterized protein n=1 Tax=Wolfiporia cocos (strain MD-104) TaxID=742152 RepID=A0A2H3JK06_WOLCO|nr:hypothetical protein WOLCODRAFT_159515 [Wolfiporia cocos MD-104 SS10]